MWVKIFSMIFKEFCWPRFLHFLLLRCSVPKILFAKWRSSFLLLQQLYQQNIGKWMLQFFYTTTEQESLHHNMKGNEGNCYSPCCWVRASIGPSPCTTLPLSLKCILLSRLMAALPFDDFWKKEENKIEQRSKAPIYFLTMHLKILGVDSYHNTLKH